MSRKDYFLLTKTLREAYCSYLETSNEEPTVNRFYHHLIEETCKSLKADNPNFSESKFRLAIFLGEDNAAYIEGKKEQA